MVVRRRRTSATEEANRIFKQSDKNQVSVVIGSGEDGDSTAGVETVLLGWRIYEGYQSHFSTVMQCTV